MQEPSGPTAQQRRAEDVPQSPCVTDGAAPCRLLELTIRSLAIIDALRIEWTDGLNLLSGETGAGKSIIVDALGAALGDRVDLTLVRSGADRASVEAVFSVASDAHTLRATLGEVGCALDDDLLVLTREIAQGRSISRINGRTVPASVVQQLAERLIGIHSQASHLALLRTQEQRDILDGFAQTGDTRAQMAEAARALIEIRGEIQRVEQGRRRVEREATLLRHEVQEIDAAALHTDEEDQLVAQRGRLKNALRLQQLATTAHDALQGSDAGDGALGLLEEAAAALEEIRGLDPSGPVGGDRLVDVIDGVEDLVRAFRRYADSVEDDPSALDTLEERLLLIAELKRKYGATLGDVLGYRSEAARRLEELEHHEERIAELRAAEVEQVRAAERLATALSIARAGAAGELERAVESELAELGMAGARFVVEITRRLDPIGLTLEGAAEPVAFDESGVDHVQFLISANPGEPPRPLARIASGGELARFMLALKSVLSTADRTPILIFDELDQGVGGRMGHVIGEKLWRLARGHQVLCITHLAQIASYADAHFAVGKGVEGGRTTVAVGRLSEEEQLDELALMLAGSQAGPAARRSAEELRARASEWKAALPDG